MTIKEIFFNQYGNWRSGWRFLIFLLLFLFLGGITGAIVQVICSRMAWDLNLRSVLFISINSVLSLTLALLIGWFCGKSLENLPFRALGAWFTQNWFKDLSLGLLLGALTVSSAVLIAVIFGGLSFNFNRTQENSAVWLTLVVSLAVFIVAAAFEEAFFRGYMLQTFARANLAWLSIFLTSIFFAVGHLGNDNATILSTVNTALAGIWFSVAYLKTRTLWLPFGLHLMWNWFQGAIFGIEVSGITSLTTAPLLNEIDSGPIWLTGEKYGIEGGIVCTIALIFSTLLIWYMPIIKPTEEMLALTSEEKSNGEIFT